MPAYRFFKKKAFESQQTLIIEDDEFHHLKNVMRHKEGDHIEIINGMGGLAFAEIMEIKKRHATVAISQVEFFTKKQDIILLQAEPKIHKLELIIEKGTELGMSELHLFKGEKGVQKLTEEKLTRLELKAISALKQSGRYYLPVIKIVPPIKNWEISFHHAYYGEVHIGAPPLYKKLPTCLDASAIYFCCGPEAGFSEKETSDLKEKNFKGISLHTNVLRAETAPLVFLSLMHHHLLIQGDGPVIN
jgi:16S rRNA (uracil1498-N3)-methyltransferase